ncbi:MAG: carbamoyltransferase HypF, partial [Methylohalobius sp.]
MVRLAQSACPSGLEIRLFGLVQGVGFRPYVWRLAKQFGLTGSVENCGQGIRIRAFGEPETLVCFREQLLTMLPPGARIEKIDERPLYEAAPDEFKIEASTPGVPAPFVLPDLASCAECRLEVFSPSLRRYLYPFTSCTQCGARFSVVHSLPYDRERTSFSAFALCPACLAEYQNPADRRFHAQTTACPVCGPKVWLEPSKTEGRAALSQAVEQLRLGKILAVKGQGGFQLLACATNPQTLARLRQRKRRPHKPLALMARDLEVVRRYCAVSPEEEQALTSQIAPIVLLAAKEQTLPSAVAPGLDLFGFLLPYSPLHHLLMAQFTVPLVFTSGNLSGDPLCADNDEAQIKLSPIADAFVLHDYSIVHPCDDSVVRFMAGKIRVLRRGRGLAPAPVALPLGFEQ